MSVVLLATDGSDEATRAATRAVALANEQAAPLHVLSVVDRRRFNEPALSTLELATVEAEDHGYATVTAVRELAETAGVAVTGIVRHGLPPEAILEYADEVDAEAIIVGEHGDHTEHLGGVGRDVATRADRKVEVVSSRIRTE